MKLCILVSEDEEFTNELSSFLEKKEKNIKISSKKASKVEYDIYLIISNNTENIKKQSEKINDKNRILIITSNFNANHIISCIGITPYVIYKENNFEKVYFKISSIINGFKIGYAKDD